MSHTSTFFDAFFRQAPIGMAIVGINGNVIRANPQYCQLLGYDEEELKAISLSALVHPDDWTAYQEALSPETHQDLSQEELELRFIQKNGENVWAKVSYSQSQDDSGTTVGLLSLTDISAMKATNDKLQEIEARHKRVIEAASIGMYDWNLQTNQSYWNDSNYELLNIPKGDETPNFQAVLANLSAEERASAQQKMKAVIETGGVYENEYPILLPDGSYRYILSRGKITERDADGKALILSGVLTDITAQKLAQEQARKAEARFNKVVEANLIGVLLFHRDGSIREANNAFLDLLGFTRAELEAGLLNWRELTPPDYQHVNDRNERIINRTGVMPISEKQYFHKDGHRVDVILAVAMFEDDPDSGVGFIVDNTFRKQQERALRESEENWRIMANFIPQMVWMADPYGRRYWFNQRWHDYTGTSLEECYGWSWSKLLHPDHVERVIASIQKAWASEEPWEESYLIRGKDGHYHWFLGRALPIRNEEGQIMRWFGTSTDITAMHETQDALQQSQRELTASNRDLEQFASIASHDLQAPLRKAKYFCDIVFSQAQGKLDEMTLDLLSRTQIALDNMQDLIKDLLELSSVCQEPQNFEIVDLNIPLQQVLSNLSETIKDTKADIIVESLGSVYGNTRLLTQLLQNLIENALKYQQPGHQPVISIRSVRLDHHCQIIVNDNGIGFPRAEAERIFKPFERLHGKSSPYKGTGMGLAICQRIVERHQGTIIAHSAPNQGATFSISLPVHSKIPTTPANWNPAQGKASHFAEPTPHR